MVEEDYMRNLIITAAMLAMTSIAFAGQAVTQLGSAVEVEVAETGVAMPAAPVLDVVATEAVDVANGDEDKGWLDDQYCRKHKMRPGCPLFCQMNPIHKSCGHIPAYCQTNPNGYGCK